MNGEAQNLYCVVYVCRVRYFLLIKIDPISLQYWFNHVANVSFQIQDAEIEIVQFIRFPTWSDFSALKFLDLIVIYVVQIPPRKTASS